MTNKETVNRNIGLTFDLIQKIIDNPDLADKIPDNSEIEFVDKDFEVRKKGYAKNSKLIKVKNEIEIPQVGVWVIGKLAHALSISSTKKRFFFGLWLCFLSVAMTE